MNSFVYYDGESERVPQWGEGVVVPLSSAAKCAKFALDRTDHVVLSRIYKERIRYVAVDLNKVDCLLKSTMNHEIIELAWRDRLDRIVLGRDMWNQVVDHFASREISFVRDMFFGWGDSRKMLGINVQVLPNMEGYLILPKFTPIFDGAV